MTKDEILKKSMADNPIVGRGMVINFPALALGAAMDEYAKQQAIGFAEYLGMWGWELCPAGHSESGKWISPTNIQYGFKTIEELYTLYLNQKYGSISVALDEKIRTQALEAAMRIVGADGEFHNVGGITYNPGQKILLVCESIYQWLTKDVKP